MGAFKLFYERGRTERGCLVFDVWVVVKTASSELCPLHCEMQGSRRRGALCTL